MLLGFSRFSPIAGSFQIERGLAVYRERSRSSLALLLATPHDTSYSGFIEKSAVNPEITVSTKRFRNYNRSIID